MAFDPGLEARIDALTENWSLTKKPMFGGLAYLADGNMCFAIGEDELLFKVGDGQTRTELLQRPGIKPSVMGKRTMRNWAVADGNAISEDEQLLELMKIGRDIATH